MVPSGYVYEDGLAEAIRAMVRKVLESVVLQLFALVHASFEFSRERSPVWNKLWDILLKPPSHEPGGGKDESSNLC